MKYDHLTIVEKPESQQICVSVFLLLLSTNPSKTTELCSCWAQTPQTSEPGPSITSSLPFPRSRTSTSLSLAMSRELAACEVAMNISLVLYLSHKVCEGLQWFRFCQLPWAAVEHSQFISSSTIKQDSFYSKMPRFYNSLHRICLNRWVWKLFFPVYKSMLNHAILPCWYWLRFAQSYSPLPILQTFQEREHSSKPAKQEKKKKRVVGAFRQYLNHQNI